MAEPLSEAQQLLARLKVRNEQSKAAAAGLSTAPADTSNAPSLSSTGGAATSNNKPSFKASSTSWAADSATLPAEDLEEGEPDATTITSISKIVLRGAGGFCLSAVAVEATAAAGAADTAVPAPTRFRGSAEGRGFGDPHECLTMHNRHAVRLAPTPTLGHNHSKSSLDVAAQPMRYGDRVMLRSHFARERCLAPLPGAGGDLAFERNLGGKAEDWELLPAATGPTDSAGFDNAASARRQLSYAGAGGRANSGYPASLGSSYAEPGSLSGSAGAKPVRGACLRSGDRIALKSCLTGELLELRQASGSRSSSSNANVGTAPAGHSSSDACTWTVLVAGAPYMPLWAQQRPYLTGQFLLQPQRSAPSARVVEQLFGAASARFVAAGQHGASSGGGALDSASDDGHDLLPPHGSTQQDPPPLSTLPAPVQEQLVLDDLLSAFMGLEGTYVKAQVMTASSAGENGVQGGWKGRCQDSDHHANKDDENDLSRIEFVFNGLKLDKSLGALAERMLPCGSAYVGVKAFVHGAGQPARGLVAHALGAGLKVLLKEYLVLVAQLEHQLRADRLTLQKLWFFVQPALHTLLCLDAVCVACKHTTGGALLNALSTCADRFSGDARSAELLTFLQARASAPYVEMLRRWIYEGFLDDPYREFMVAEEESVSKETVSEDFTTAYWEKRYTLRPHQVASFLARHQDRVLTTGKYLNVLRECGRDIRCPDADVSNDDAGAGGSGALLQAWAPGGVGNGSGSSGGLGDAANGEVINRAFFFASSTLLKALRTECRLVNRLRSMKHYFLLDQGDLYVNFMDLAEDELKQPLPKVSKARVEALLQLAVQSSVANLDPFKDDLCVAFSQSSMIQHLEAIHAKDGSSSHASLAAAASSSGSGVASTTSSSSSQLKGIEVFMVDYKVAWPVSLVVSKRSLTKYQLVFRHLFFARHVERCLKQTWQGQQRLKELDVRAAGGRSYCLRHRMLGFMQDIVYYFTYEVIEPRWHEMEQKMAAATDMDAVLTSHAELQDLILKECLLTNQDLLKVLTKIMTICLLFAEQMNRFFEANQVAAAAATHEPDPSESAYLNAQALPGSGSGGLSYEGSQAGGLEGHGSLGRDAEALGSGRGDSTALRRARVAAFSAQIKAELEQASYVKMVASYEKNFDQLLKDFMGWLAVNARYQANTHLANLVTRLDYNGFFSEGRAKP